MLRGAERLSPQTFLRGLQLELTLYQEMLSQRMGCRVYTFTLQLDFDFSTRLRRAGRENEWTWTRSEKIIEGIGSAPRMSVLYYLRSCDPFQGAHHVPIRRDGLQ